MTSPPSSPTTAHPPPLSPITLNYLSATPDPFAPKRWPDLFWLVAIILWSAGSLGGFAYGYGIGEYDLAPESIFAFAITLVLIFNLAPFFHPLLFVASVLLAIFFSLGYFIKTLWLRILLLLLIAALSTWASYILGSAFRGRL
jgi:hypothetical protein